MNVAIELTGMTGLVMHNERLADKQDEFARAIAEITSKRKKTAEDAAAIERLEFLGGLYYDPDVGVYVPAWNVVRCLEEAAKIRRLGTALIRALSVTTDRVVVEYSGPRKPPELWEAPAFRFRKSVGVQRNKVMRMRPIFRKWSVCLQAELLADVLDPSDLTEIANAAGRSIGLGDARKLGYGRFVAAVAA